jgi:hypothetical protein
MLVYCVCVCARACVACVACVRARGVVWCGGVWCGVVWCGVGWCGVVWCGVVWCGVVCGVVRYECALFVSAGAAVVTVRLLGSCCAAHGGIRVRGAAGQLAEQPSAAAAIQPHVRDASSRRGSGGPCAQVCAAHQPRGEGLRRASAGWQWAVQRRLPERAGCV